MLRLDGGKERKLLPIRTTCNYSEASRRRGCVRTENAGANRVLLDTPATACVCVKPPAPRPSKLPIVDGTDHVVAPGKPFASWCYGTERTGVLSRRHARRVRLKRRFRTRIQFLSCHRSPRRFVGPLQDLSLERAFPHCKKRGS